MVDPKRLIESMELCMGTERDCHKCMYCETENDCRGSMIYDAVELLKEQEPRVLTWDEVERAEVCWLEERGLEETYAELDAADWNPEYYGKDIRCWNYKPTKKQMEAVKWDGIEICGGKGEGTGDGR